MMTVSGSPIIFLPGSGGGTPDLSLLKSNAGDTTQFVTVEYPGWQRYVANGFSPESLVAELADRIEAAVPHGPIRILGLSMGGHFGYVSALHLQKKGREVAGFCAIDSFMISTAEPTSGWQGRALAECWELIRNRRGAELIQFVRSKFWRALLRLAGPRLPRLMDKFSQKKTAGPASANSIMERELSMRLLVRQVAPWLAHLDDNPAPLTVPSALLRTPLHSGDDAAWRRRCPNIKILDIPGRHHSLFEPENAAALRQAFLTGTGGWC